MSSDDRVQHIPTNYPLLYLYFKFFTYLEQNTPMCLFFSLNFLLSFCFMKIVAMLFGTYVNVVPISYDLCPQDKVLKTTNIIRYIANIF